jgi:hypothetical protein
MITQFLTELDLKPIKRFDSPISILVSDVNYVNGIHSVIKHDDFIAVAEDLGYAVNTKGFNKSLNIGYSHYTNRLKIVRAERVKKTAGDK